MLNLHSCYVRDLDSKWSMAPSITSHHLLIFITSGKLVYRVDKHTYPLQKGDVLFIPAGCLRSGAAIELHQRYVAFFSSGGEDDMLLPILAQKSAYQLQIQNFAYFKQRFSLLNHHWLNKGPYFAASCSAILLEMLSLINCDLDQQEIGTKKAKLAEDVKKYIESHYQEPLKLQELSLYCGKTPNYISSVFKAVTGFTPIEYLHNVRISAAKDLMLYKSMSVRKIAEQTGFCDQSYFTRVFKKMTGHSPTDFLNEITISKIKV